MGIATSPKEIVPETSERAAMGITLPAFSWRASGMPPLGWLDCLIEECADGVCVRAGQLYRVGRCQSAVDHINRSRHPSSVFQLVSGAVPGHLPWHSSCVWLTARRVRTCSTTHWHFCS